MRRQQPRGATAMADLVLLLLAQLRHRAPVLGAGVVGDEGGVRTYTGEQITTANDEFAMLVTVCTLVSDRAGFGRFLTLALPRGPASPEDDTVQGILISTRRQDLHGSMTIRSQEVQSVSGTARPVLP